MESSESKTIVLRGGVGYSSFRNRHPRRMSQLDEAVARYNKLLETGPHRDLAWAEALHQRMEASNGLIRGNVDSLMKLVVALETAGIELISENANSARGGRGVRLKEPAS